MAARSPKCERPVIAGFIVVRRRSTGFPVVTARTPDDRRRDTGGASAENLVISRENRPAAIVRRPQGDFTTLFKVKKIGRRATDLEK